MLVSSKDDSANKNTLLLTLYLAVVSTIGVICYFNYKKKYKQPEAYESSKSISALSSSKYEYAIQDEIQENIQENSDFYHKETTKNQSKNMQKNPEIEKQQDSIVKDQSKVGDVNFSLRVQKLPQTASYINVSTTEKEQPEYADEARTSSPNPEKKEELLESQYEIQEQSKKDCDTSNNDQNLDIVESKTSIAHNMEVNQHVLVESFLDIDIDKNPLENGKESKDHEVKEKSIEKNKQNEKKKGKTET